MDRKSAKFVKVGAINTRYIEGGNGEPVVFIHGGNPGTFYSYMIWDLNLEPLSKYFHAIAFDRLAMGFTDNPADPKDFRYNSLTRHSIKFIKTLNLDKVTLVGHSRGGFVATRIAIESPELVKNLILVDSGTTAPDIPPRVGDFYAEVDKGAPELETRESVQREVLANSYRKDNLTEQFKEDLWEIASMDKTVEARKIFYKTEVTEHTDNLRRETLNQIEKGRIKCPTLLLWGMQDPSALVERGFNLFKVVSKTVDESQLQVINHAGHYLFRDKPESFNRALRAFIE